MIYGTTLRANANTLNVRPVRFTACPDPIGTGSPGDVHCSRACRNAHVRRGARRLTLAGIVKWPPRSRPDRLIVSDAAEALTSRRTQLNRRPCPGSVVTPADLSGVSGTPTFFVNGKRHHGAYDITTLTDAVRAARARALISRGRQPRGHRDQLGRQPQNAPIRAHSRWGRGQSPRCPGHRKAAGAAAPSGWLMLGGFPP